MINPYRIFLVCLLLASNGLTGAWAAPITGSNQAEPTPGADEAPAPDAVTRAPVGNPDATVIEFSVMPSADDPTRMETVVIVQQSGRRRVCVNLKSTDVITRSYRKRGDEPFSPAIPGDIQGLTSGDTGSLVGFNDTSVFIRPHTIDDTFTNQDECFIAGEVEGCFLPDEDDCDQPLEEGDVACVLGTISRTGCSVLDHAGLARQLRILITLNQPPGEAPIITAADIAAAPEIVVAPEGPGADLPAGPAPAGPTAAAPPGGGGGGEFITIPDVIGLTIDVAKAEIILAGGEVGNVTVVNNVTWLENVIIRPARAQDPDLAETIGQSFVGVCELPCPPVDLVGQFAAAIPEPPSLALFAMGLGLLILITWWRRRSS